MLRVYYSCKISALDQQWNNFLCLLWSTVRWRVSASSVFLDPQYTEGCLLLLSSWIHSTLKGVCFFCLLGSTVHWRVSASSVFLDPQYTEGCLLLLSSFFLPRQKRVGEMFQGKNSGNYRVGEMFDPQYTEGCLLLLSSFFLPRQKRVGEMFAEVTVLQPHR